ncbi:MAG: right-handed parallel beta-helix repeat-containing protein [Archangiaceae bacterium]|nr:right-handed parallel beta-helix repeat-containing protein [Archangiaceae bacterium]
MLCTALLAAACGPIEAEDDLFGADEGELSTRRSRTLLLQRVGYGASVTGGEAATRLTHVTTAADSGPGSLRAALTAQGPAWVVFDGDYVIRLLSPINLTSDKTVDARGRHVVINGNGGRGSKARHSGFEIDHVSNVIITNLTFEYFGDQDLTEANNPADEIQALGADRVWIHHNTLGLVGDKAVSVMGGSTRVTVSWNHFHDQQQNMQLGSQSTGALDVLQTVTVHHNFFDDQNQVPTPPTVATYQNSGYRHPAAAYGRAHLFNNVDRGWSAFSVRSERGERLLLENNVFIAGAKTGAISTRPQGVPPNGPPPGTNCAPMQACVAPYKNICGCNDTCKNCDPTPGALLERGNLALNGAQLDENDPQAVVAGVLNAPDFYTYRAEQADSALVAAVTTGAGAHW